MGLLNQTIGTKEYIMYDPKMYTIGTLKSAIYCESMHDRKVPKIILLSSWQ